VFQSSGTASGNRSHHFVKSLSLYKKSFSRGFEYFYGAPEKFCILALLPSYLEKGNSSLVYMAADLVRQSKHPLSGFYLHDLEKLHSTILHNEIQQTPTLLLGVTYALLDFACSFPMKLEDTLVIETGGMKGRKEEMTRYGVHEILKSNLGLEQVHSEYGMTELLSQAWSQHGGIFNSSPTLKILIRDEDDPGNVTDTASLKDKPVTGAINVIDLANLYSCSFIATDDVGTLYKNGSFEVLGRLDNSDIRGCSLLTLT
jgi:hypothetical protein